MDNLIENDKIKRRALKYANYYDKRKRDILINPSICEENRKLFKKFFTFQEDKLKEIRETDTLCYSNHLTLLSYIRFFKNVNKWFKNKPWKDLTKKEIRQVIKDLKIGNITKEDGTPYKDKSSYFKKVFRSEAFKMVGKDKITKELLKGYKPPKTIINYIEEEQVDILAPCATIDYEALIRIVWDLSVEINTALAFQRKHFERIIREDGKIEYKVHIKDNQKTSRTIRKLVTFDDATADVLDRLFKRGKFVVIETEEGTDRIRRRIDNTGKRKKIKCIKKYVPYDDEDYIFYMGYAQSKKYLRNLANKRGIKSKPDGLPIKWKDFRSGRLSWMARKKLGIADCQQRAGHVLGGRAITKYLAIDSIDSEEQKKFLEEKSEEAYEKKVKKQQKKIKVQTIRMDLLQKRIGELETKNKKNHSLNEKVKQIESKQESDRQKNKSFVVEYNKILELLSVIIRHNHQNIKVPADAVQTREFVKSLIKEGEKM